MVYKKYIERNGKIYGPYRYNSRRVDGKVVSEYQGVDRKNYKKFIFLSLGILFLIFLVFFALDFKGKISGNVVSEFDSNTQTEEILEKTLIYPKIYFTLILTKLEKEEISKESSEEIIPEKIEEIPITNSSAEEIIVNQTVNKNLIDSEEEPVLENSSETIQEENPIIPAENNLEEEVLEKTEILEIEEIASENPEIPKQETADETSESITEGVVSQVLDSVSNFFLSFLNPTGMVVSDSSFTQIKGETSVDEPFTYEISEGENIELLSGSVRTDSEELPDYFVTLYFQGSEVLVKTNYSEYTELNSELIKTNSSANETKEIEIKNFSIIDLNEEEKEILLAEFGNFSIEPVKYELFNGRYVVRYELGKYNIEYSYDSDLKNETLEKQIEKDKVKWFKDIINEIK
jgi:hypothetical protein